MASSQPRSIWGDLIDSLPESEHQFLDHIGRLRDEGALEHASQRLDQALERAQSPRLRKVKGRIEVERNNFVRAAEVVEPLCRGDDSDPDALLIYARTQSALGQIEKAQKTLERARLAGAHPDDIASLCREVDSLPEPTDEEPLAGRPDLRDESEPTLDVSNKWEEIAASMSDEEGQSHRSHSRKTSESPMGRRSRPDTSPDSDTSQRETAKAKVVLPSERANSPGSGDGSETDSSGQSDSDVSDPLFSSADVPSAPDEGHVDSPHKRITTQSSLIDGPYPPEDASEAEESVPSDGEDDSPREEVSTAEPDADAVAEAPTDDPLHSEAPGPWTDDNPFEEMDDTIADSGRRAPTSDLPNRKAPAKPDRSDPDLPLAEADSESQSETRDALDEKLERNIQTDEPSSSADSKPHEPKPGVPSADSDEPTDDRLPDSEEASHVFQITTSPEATGLNLADLLVEPPLDQEGTDTSDISPSDFERLETNPVHEYAESRDDFQLADPKPEGLFDGNRDPRPDAPPPPRPSSSEEDPTLDRRDGVPSAPRSRPEESEHAAPDEETDPKFSLDRRRGEVQDASREHSTEPEVPGAKSPADELPSELRDPIPRERAPQLDATAEPDERSRDAARPASGPASNRDRPHGPTSSPAAAPDNPPTPHGLDEEPRPDPPARKSSGAPPNRASAQRPDANRGESPKRVGDQTEPFDDETELYDDRGRSFDDDATELYDDGGAFDDETELYTDRNDSFDGDQTEPFDENRLREGGPARRANRRAAPPGGSSDEQGADRLEPSNRNEIRRNFDGDSGRVHSGESRVAPPPERPEPSDQSKQERRSFIERAKTVVSFPNTLGTRDSILIASISFATVCVAVLFIGGLTANLDADRLSETIREAESARSLDTYRGWRESFEIADNTLENEPDVLRRFLHAVGSVLPGGDPVEGRRELAAERAYAAAVLEYRFEAFGSREAKSHADDAFGGPRVSPLAASAATYRLLALGRSLEAVDLAQSMHNNYPAAARLARAQLEAHLHAKNTGDVVREARDLRDRPGALAIYDRYLLARSARFQDETSADELLDNLVSEHSPLHLDAEITQVEYAVEDESLERALRLGRRLLEERSESASPYQKARLHIALGEVHRRKGEMARAEEQARSAVDTLPGRASVYLPLTDLFISEGRLEEANELVREAEENAQTNPALTERRALLQFLNGRLEAALSLLDGEAAGQEKNAVLRGRIHYERGDYQQARSVLNALNSSHSRYAAAQSIEVLARTRLGVDDPDNAVARLAALRERAPNDPLVARSAARLRLKYARRAADEDERDEHLDHAEKLLETADDIGSNRALTDYFRCDLFLLNGADDAGNYCRSAKRTHPAFIPGLVARARLRLSQGEPERAAKLLEDVAGRVDRRWDVDRLHVRARVRNFEAGRARSILDRWIRQKQSESEAFALLEGLAAFFAADYRDAAGFFDKAKSSHRHENEATLYHAHTLVRLEEFDEAESLLRLLTDDPEWRGPSWSVFGELRRRQDRPEDALQNLRIARRQFDSDSVPGWRVSHLYAERALAWSQRRGWDDSRVRRNLRRGRERGLSKSPDLSLARGLRHLEGSTRNLEQAANRLREVIDLQPHRCEAIHPLLETYRELGETQMRAEVAKLEQENCD